MTETKLHFELARPAKKAGGDRYEYLTKDEKGFMAIYIPQHISRKVGVPLKKLTITITT